MISLIFPYALCSDKKKNDGNFMTDLVRMSLCDMALILSPPDYKSDSLQPLEGSTAYTSMYHHFYVLF